MAEVYQDQGVLLLHEVDAAAASVLLMRDAIVECLADHPRVVLGNLERKEAVVSHVAICEVSNLLEGFFGVEDERRREVSVVQLDASLILQYPRYPGYGGRQMVLCLPSPEE